MTLPRRRTATTPPSSTRRRLDAAVTGPCPAERGRLAGHLSAASLRALIVRATSALPALPSDLVDPIRVRPHYARYLETPDRHRRPPFRVNSPATLARRIGAATDPSRLRTGGEAVNQSYLRRLRQRLGLRLLEHDVRVPWLDQAIEDADRRDSGFTRWLRAPGCPGNSGQRTCAEAVISTARQLLARVIPESFTPSWRRDSQLKEWVRGCWRLTAAQPWYPARPRHGHRPAAGRADRGYRRSRRGSRSAAAGRSSARCAAACRPARRMAAGARRPVIRRRPRVPAVRLRRPPSSTRSTTSQPAARIDDAAALLSAVVAGILAPARRTRPAGRWSGQQSCSEGCPRARQRISEQLARAVDIHVLPGIRGDWRRTLDLPQRPPAPVMPRTRQSPDDAGPRLTTTRWGKSEFGLFKAADGTMTKPDVVLQSVTDLSGALAWRSAQGEAGTFSWLPVLEPLISRAGNTSLRQIIEGFRRYTTPRRSSWPSPGGCRRSETPTPPPRRPGRQSRRQIPRPGAGPTGTQYAGRRGTCSPRMAMRVSAGKPCVISPNSLRPLTTGLACSCSNSADPPRGCPRPACYQDLGAS